MAVEPTAATKASVTLFSGHESGRWATTLVSSAQYPECVDGTVPGCVGSALRIDFTRVSTSQSATKRVLSGIQTSSFVHTCIKRKISRLTPHVRQSICGCRGRHLCSELQALRCG